MDDLIATHERALAWWELARERLRAALNEADRDSAAAVSAFQACRWAETWSRVLQHTALVRISESHRRLCEQYGLPLPQEGV